MVKVALVKGKSARKIVWEALELIEAGREFTTGDRVLVKPNYVVASKPSTGFTTDTGVVEALIEYFRKAKVEDLTLGEGGAGDTERAFDVVGVRDVCARHNVRLVNLNRDERVTVKTREALALREVDIAKTVLDSTCIVNVPVLKVHHMALVTLCIKNLMGAIIPKSVIHSGLNEKLADLSTVIKPKINLISGIFGAEVDETRGNTVKMDLVIAGKDIVAVDAIGCMVMGIDPHKVRYLRLAEEKGVGTLNLNDIEVVGENVDSVRRDFKLPPSFKREKFALRRLSPFTS